LISLKKNNAKNYNDRSARIIADHIKTAVFVVSAGVIPSSTGRGYVLRRLIRRSVSHAEKIGVKGMLGTIRDAVVDIYVPTGLLAWNAEMGLVISNEMGKFGETLEHGLKEFEKGVDPFILATTFGFPIELTMELAEERGKKIDLNDFNKKMAEHQKLSQTSSAGMFKGGLANHNEKTIRLHTAHHLLLSALQEVLGKNVKQRGSNITEERLRIDFAFDRKMTDEEKKRVEEIVNKEIQSGLSVVRREMPRVEAEKIGAEMEFGVKYPDTVSVYFIEDSSGNSVSKEFCGGPHVTNTNELGIFKIQKEEASSQGVRRIKAVLG
jgi:alanyl-tRNA synthetase